MVADTNFKKGLDETLLNCSNLVSQHGDVYHKKRADGSTVGAHMRHIIEHYEEFFLGVDRGLLNYEARKRELRLEQDPKLALARLSGIRKKLADISVEAMSNPITLTESVSQHYEPESHVSSVSRELSFLNLHTVHHLAIIREILRLFGQCVPEDMGVAPATLKYNSQAK